MGERLKNGETKVKIMSVGRSVRDPHVVKVRLTNWPRLRDKIQSDVNKDDSLKIPSAHVLRHT